MFDYLYEWTQNLAFYMVLITVVLQALPASDYKKYIRFFTGMVLILMVLTPVFKLFGMDGQVSNFYKSREYERKIEEMEREAQGILEKLKDHENIEVEEIEIER